MVQLWELLPSFMFVASAGIILQHYEIKRGLYIRLLQGVGAGGGCGAKALAYIYF